MTDYRDIDWTERRAFIVGKVKDIVALNFAELWAQSGRMLNFVLRGRAIDYHIADEVTARCMEKCADIFASGEVQEYVLSYLGRAYRNVLFECFNMRSTDIKRYISLETEYDNGKDKPRPLYDFLAAPEPQKSEFTLDWSVFTEDERAVIERMLQDGRAGTKAMRKSIRDKISAQLLAQGLPVPEVQQGRYKSLPENEKREYRLRIVRRQYARSGEKRQEQRKAMRDYMRAKHAAETPEQRAERNAKRMQKYYEQKKQREISF